MGLVTLATLGYCTDRYYPFSGLLRALRKRGKDEGGLGGERVDWGSDWRIGRKEEGGGENERGGMVLC